MDTCASKFSQNRKLSSGCRCCWSRKIAAILFHATWSTLLQLLVEHCSGRLSAPLPFQQLFQDSPHEQDMDNEEIMLPMPPRALLQCSDACCSYSGNMKLSTARSERSLPSQQLSQDSPQEQDAEDEEIVSQFCLRAPVRCSDGFSDDFIAPSIEEVDFDSSKSEFVCKAAAMDKLHCSS